MAALSAAVSAPSLLNEIEAAIWPSIKSKLAPVVWEWFDNHKDDRITKLFGMYPVNLGSFGVAEYVITELFGAKP